MISEIRQIPMDAVRSAALRSEVVDAVESLLRELDSEIASNPATCWNKGECCRFGEYGHRLFVTTLEVAFYLARDSSQAENLSASPSPSLTRLPILDAQHSDEGPMHRMASDSCPHAHGGRCHARERRPLGCRIFYCDPAAQGWQGPMTERYLARLRDLHEKLNVPYVYADWMMFLKGLGRV